MKSNVVDWYKGLYFSDGKTVIDFVLVWKVSSKTKLLEMAELARSNFHKALISQNINLEEEIHETPNKKIHFMKINIPWKEMCKRAEELKLRTPLQVEEETTSHFWKFLEKTFDHRAPKSPIQYITCAFKENNLKNYLGYKNQNTFFTTCQRHQVAYTILGTTPYGDPDVGQVGIDRLVEENIYDAIYPLNEGTYQVMPEELVNPESLSMRQVLYYYWARARVWYRYQPLNHIRDYYGEKIAIYFAWLGCYTEWLFPLGIMGLVCFIYGLATLFSDTPVQRICSRQEPIRMCPFCEEANGCNYWWLHDFCSYRRIGYLFDNPGSVCFAIFTVAWAAVFLEMWKRRCSKLSYRWDVFDYEQEEEALRPQFISACTGFNRSRITGQMEPWFPTKIRNQRICFGAVIFFLMLVMVIIFMIAIIIYRILVLIPMYQNPKLSSNGKIVASMTSAVINLILIMTLGRIYTILAYKMTQWEMHETQTDFDTFLTIKVFLFQFVNYYASIFYIAFFKGRFLGHPGKFETFMGLPNEACSDGGCLVELAEQLFIIMLGEQIINNFQEILFPCIKTWYHVYTSELFNVKKKNKVAEMAESRDWKKSDTTLIPQGLKQYLEDYKLTSNEGLFGEYLEMVIQFGFITIFAAAFPLAPLFALVNNWIEIRIDAQKLVCATRRPIAERAKSIGIWMRLLETIVGISIVSNALMIAFTSEFLERMLYKYQIDYDLVGFTEFSLVAAPENSTRLPCMYQDFRNSAGEYSNFYWKLISLRLGFVIIFEHIAFGMWHLLDLFIPDIPTSLDIALRRERFLTKQATLGLAIARSRRNSLSNFSSVPARNLRTLKHKFVSSINDSPHGSSKSTKGLRSENSQITPKKQELEPMPTSPSALRKNNLRLNPKPGDQKHNETRSIEPASFVRRRSTYTHFEDLTILKYLISNNLVEKSNLRSTWRQLEADKVTQHTAESMRNRVKRSIANDLPLLLPDSSAEYLTTLRTFLLMNSPPIQLSSVDLFPVNQLYEKPSGYSSPNNTYSSILTDDNHPPIVKSDVTPVNPPMVNFSPIQKSPHCDPNNSDCINDSIEDVPHPSTSTQRPLSPYQTLFHEITIPQQDKPSQCETSNSLDLLATATPYWFPITTSESSAETSSTDMDSIVTSTAAAIDCVDEFCSRWSAMSLTRNEAFILLHCCSGSLETAEKVLLEPFQPVWLPVDDALLTSSQTRISDLEDLGEKFGREAVLNRVAYLSNHSSLFRRMKSISV